MSEPTNVTNLDIEINHGQVYIYSDPPWRVDPAQAEAVLRALDDAQNSGRYVGVAAGLVDLVVPTNWNFNAPMRVEVWASEPTPDHDDWDNVVDVDLSIVDDTLHFEGSGGRPAIKCTVPTGDYRARVAGRGYDELKDRVEGMDSYRLQLWPRLVDAPPTLHRRWAGW
ncbi:hypothetical protein [Saccharothrix sp.]|uniref:hypothetical protein n=1 Tax=Saccharothrix sp. TaxID=1873460 RepID=UPI002811CE35|nr:hypothetical protein [Saccharothrix sp.]